MAVKLADTLKPMADFPAAMAEDINIVQANNTQKSLQKMYEDGELGGGGGLIDDTTQSSDTTYSSYKIEEKVAGMINDTATESETTTYSAKKINSEISSLITADEGIRNTVGDITSLSTTDKSSVVAAINETNVNLGVLEKKVIEHYADDINIDTKEGTWDADFSSTSGDTHGTFPVKGMWTKVIQEESNFFRKQIATLFDTNGRVRSYERGKWISDGSTWSAWQELATMDKIPQTTNIIAFDNATFSGNQKIDGKVITLQGTITLNKDVVAYDTLVAHSNGGTIRMLDWKINNANIYNSASYLFSQTNIPAGTYIVNAMIVLT